MWTNINQKQPKKNDAYRVYNTANFGTEHDTPEIATAYWDKSLGAFTDREGDQFIPFYDSIEWWWDDAYIAPPEIDSLPGINLPIVATKFSNEVAHYMMQNLNLDMSEENKTQRNYRTAIMHATLEVAQKHGDFISGTLKIKDDVKTS